MNDPLDEAISAVYARHWCKEYSADSGMIRVVCKCGEWEMTRWPGHDWAHFASDEYLAHQSEALADAARAFIGDEIAAEHERLHSSTENVSETRQLRDAQWWHNGMVKAESIARGGTE